MDRACGRTGGLGQALRGTSCGRSEQDPSALGAEDVDDCAEDGGFACARATRDDGDFCSKCFAQGLGLLIGKLETSFLLRPCDRWLDLDYR